MHTLTTQFHNSFQRIIRSGILLFSGILFLNGCTATSSHQQYEYEAYPSGWSKNRYFPGANVYYDQHKRIYHYHHASTFRDS